jgi:hypothetical protein
MGITIWGARDLLKEGNLVKQGNVEEVDRTLQVEGRCGYIG